MSPANKTRSLLLVVSLVLTFVIIRTALYFYPNADFNVLGHNIHHLYTGLILIVATGIPLAIYTLEGFTSYVIVIIFGIGLSLAIDEWVYLIATDGSNISYFLPVSFWGGLILVLLTALYIGFLYYFNSSGKK